jgi:DNA-binding transcriptional LysR family regulator
VGPGKTEVDKDTGYLVPSIEIDDLDLARQVVEGSDTISWNTPLQLEPWLKKGTVKALPFRKPWMVLDYGFVYLRQRMLSPATKAYMQFVRDIEDDIAIRNRALMKHLFQ